MCSVLWKQRDKKSRVKTTQCSRLWKTFWEIKPPPFKREWVGHFCPISSENRLDSMIYKLESMISGIFSNVIDSVILCVTVESYFYALSINPENQIFKFLSSFDTRLNRHFTLQYGTPISSYCWTGFWKLSQEGAKRNTEPEVRYQKKR